MFEAEDGLVAGALESVTGKEAAEQIEEQGVIGDVFKGLKDFTNSLIPFNP